MKFVMTLMSGLSCSKTFSQFDIMDDFPLPLSPVTANTAFVVTSFFFLKK